MRSLTTTWLLLIGLLLQSVAWALPDHRAAQAGRLAHVLAHAVDHGHHGHEGDSADARGHEVDTSLQWHPAAANSDHADHDGHGSHHIHAAETGQVQGLPVLLLASALPLPAGPPGGCVLLQPPSADPRGLLRPPRRLV